MFDISVGTNIAAAIETLKEYGYEETKNKDDPILNYNNGSEGKGKYLTKNRTVHIRFCVDYNEENDDGKITKIYIGAINPFNTNEDEESFVY